MCDSLNAALLNDQRLQCGLLQRNMVDYLYFIRPVQKALLNLDAASFLINNVCVVVSHGVARCRDWEAVCDVWRAKSKPTLVPPPHARLFVLHMHRILRAWGGLSARFNPPNPIPPFSRPPGTAQARRLRGGQSQSPRLGNPRRKRDRGGASPEKDLVPLSKAPRAQPEGDPANDVAGRLQHPL